MALYHCLSEFESLEAASLSGMRLTNKSIDFEPFKFTETGYWVPTSSVACKLLR